MKLPSISTDNIRWHSSLGRPVKELSKRLMHRPHNEAPVSANLFWKGSMWKSVRLFQFVRPGEAGMPPQPAGRSGGPQISHATTAPPGLGPVRSTQQTRTHGRFASKEKINEGAAQDVKGKRKIPVQTESRWDTGTSSSSSRPDQAENRISAGIRKKKSHKLAPTAKFDIAFAAAARCDPASLRWRLVCLAGQLTTTLPRDARGSRLGGLYNLAERLPVSERLELVTTLNSRIFRVSEGEIHANFHKACALIRIFPEGEKKKAIASLEMELNRALCMSEDVKRGYAETIADPVFWWQPPD